MNHQQTVNKHPDAAIISQLGGPSALARLLRLKEKGGPQRVQNWTVRGIPARVKLDNQELFKLRRPRDQAAA